MVGPLPDVEAAVAWWSAELGVAARRHMHQGVYALRAVRPAERAPGRLRLAAEGDRATLVPWLVAFQLEALRREEMPGDDVFASFQGGGIRRLFVWEDPPGRIVAMAGRSGRTPSGVRIGPVYTPPHERGRGYGEAVVAAVAQRELGEGAQACYLFTDLEYGASNRLYTRVGYERVGTSAEFRFGAA
jgi:predicted GNAT family acetyltransferase